MKRTQRFQENDCREGIHLADSERKQLADDAEMPAKRSRRETIDGDESLQKEDGAESDILDDADDAESQNDDGDSSPHDDVPDVPDNLDELFLSDVHTGSPFPAFSADLVSTTLTVSVPAASEPQRRTAVTLHHRMSTTLENVGLQLWSGALLLADYLLARPELVREKTVLELGAGLGLPSIVAARFCGATRVTATDYGEEVLSLCEQNLKASLSERFRSESARRAGADESAAQGEAWSVREMNWLDESFPLWEDPTDSPSDTTPLPTNPPASFAWEKTDTTAFIHSTTVILAADVIYTPAATEQLVRRLKTLLQRTLRGEDRALFLAVEKRLGFTLSGEERAPSYDHFWNVMREANEELDKWGLPCLGDGAGGIPMIEGEQGVTKVPRFQWKLEPTEFQSVPQRVSGYTRTKEMEVWKMWLDY